MRKYAKIVIICFDSQMMYMARRSLDFNALLEPLERYLLAPDCTDEQVDIAIELITRLYRSAEVTLSDHACDKKKNSVARLHHFLKLFGHKGCAYWCGALLKLTNFPRKWKTNNAFLLIRRPTIFAFSLT